MKNLDYTLLGIDGGATKVSGWIVDYEEATGQYDISKHHAESSYASSENFHTDFKPVPVPDQLAERDTGSIHVTEEEKHQGSSYIDSVVETIRSLTNLGGRKPLLIGIGMPGLKTQDMRGINVINNGPRMINYCASIEEQLQEAGIELVAPIARLGSDADYCGLGELFARNGSFRSLKTAYYLGGGTGAADALLLEGKLVPFDMIKSWMAKTWEMKNDKDLSLERYASASGLQFIYSRHAKISVEKLNAASIYPTKIAELAIGGDKPAIQTFAEISDYLSWLIFERISTLFCGTKEIFAFVNPKRGALDPVHLYRGTVFDRIVIGQRLADLMASPVGEKMLTQPILKKLSKIIEAADCLPEKAKSAYLKDKSFARDKLIFSQLREAPALGAGIDAHRAFSLNKS